MARISRHRSGIPVAEIGALRGAIRRTTLQRFGLAVAALCLLLGAALAALQLPKEREGSSQQHSGVIVLDMSRSISPAKMRAVRRLLVHFATPTQRLGLVFFADTAYELLPPGSPGTALRPFIKFFTLVPIPGSDKVHLIQNPWDYDFRGGTQMSQGLAVAHRVLADQGARGEPVLIVSDLSDFSNDLPRVGKQLAALRRDHIPVRVAPIDATPTNRQLFERLAGTGAFVRTTSLNASGVRRVKASATSAIAVALVVIGVALLALLGLNEFWCGRLTVPAAKAGEAR